MNLLATRRGRLSVFTLLYFSEGAPIGFLWWALPTWLRAEGVPVERVTGLTAMLVMPWVFKFLWAPLVDTLRSPRWGFRAWILLTQTLMGLSLLPLLWIDLVDGLGLVTGLLLFHAFFAATQDVAVDAWVISISPVEEHGRLNGAMQAGMLLGRSLFGGGVLILGDRLGWPAIVLALILAIWGSLLLLALVQAPSAAVAPVVAQDFLRTLGRVFRGRTTWLGLGFALLAAAAFETTGALAGPYLLDQGADKESIGRFLGLVVVVCTLVGGLIGGPLSDAWGRVRSVAVFLVGFVVAVAVLAGLGWLAPQAGLELRMALLAGMYFFVGLFTAASYALFMDLTDRRLGATQFSTYMAATNGCEAWSAKAGGEVAGRLGYEWAFGGMCLVSLASLTLLRRIWRGKAWG